MSRLINFGPGEIVDRLSILALKLTHGQAAGKSVDHFQAEWDALVKYPIPFIELPVANVIRLTTVNGLLWQAEDDLRKWRPGLTDYEAHLVADLAFRIQDLNDQRATLVQTINQVTGTSVGSEKL